MYELLYRSVALCETIISTLQEIIELTVVDSNHGALIVEVLGQYQPFVDVMTWCDPISELKEAGHELRAYNQTRKEVVETNENARKNLSCSHAGNQTHECLTKVGIYGQVKSKNALSERNNSQREKGHTTNRTLQCSRITSYPVADGSTEQPRGDARDPRVNKAEKKRGHDYEPLLSGPESPS